MKYFTFFILIFLNQNAFSQKNEPIYFDKLWKKTNKENAVFFRPMPMFEVGNYQLIRDYYINGDLQMQGYSLKNDVESLIGDVYYYDKKNIADVQISNDLEGLDGTFSYFYPDGKLWKKTIYKNGELNGKITSFFKDGTIMVDGLYEKGNCISGSVSYNTKLNSEFRLKKGEAQKQISKIIYWENSKQIAQKQTILLKKYGRELIGQQNFDKSGKLIQKLTENSFSSSSYYDENVSDGIKFEYYTRNDCAVNVKSETHYTSDKRNGSCVNYDTNGTIINKVIYKNNEPVEGLLEEKLNYNLLVFSNFKNSLKEGEEIAKTDKDSIIAKGIFKNGKPFNGRFVSEKYSTNNNQYSLNNYNNFELDGLQQVLDSQNKIIESYVLINGKKEGIVTIINDEIKSEVVYKNDLPFDGNLKYKNSETIYKNGFLISETTFRNADPTEISEKKEYENGKIIKVLSSSFYISDLSDKITRQYMQFIKTNDNNDKFQGFVGNYKDEKPFSGFFENEKDEFKIVDFYENGILKFQYSKDWFVTLSESERQNTELNLKSTFVDGKIVDGNEYFDYNKVKATKKWEKGILKTLDVDFFEIHYYNRMHYEIKNNTIEISELKFDDIQMILDFKDNKLNQKIIIKNKEIETLNSKTAALNDALSPNTITIYFESDNEISARNQSTLTKPNEDLNEYSSSLILKGYTSLPRIIKSKTVNELFAEIGAKFVHEENVKEMIINNLHNDEDNFKFIADLIVNKNGKPENGIWLTKNADNSFLLRLYSNGKLMKSKDKIALKDCLSAAKNLEK